MGKGVRARCLLADEPLQPLAVAYALLRQIARQGKRLPVLVEGHQVGHGLRFAGDPQLQAVQQAIENVRGIQLPGHQLVANRCPAGLFGGHQGEAIFFIEPFICRDRQRRAVSERDETHPHRIEFRFIGACGPCGLHDAR